MDKADLQNRFAYHPPRSDVAVKSHEEVRAVLHGVAQFFDDLLPEGREKSLAVTKLEEAMMWANAAIARGGERMSASSPGRTS